MKDRIVLNVEMKDRYCFECGNLLEWFNFKNVNHHLGYNYLLKIWNSNFIQLYCCECFKEDMLLSKGIIYFPEKLDENFMIIVKKLT